MVSRCIHYLLSVRITHLLYNSNHFIYFISDVLTIDRTKDYYRILYDVKGRFTLHRIRPEEATVS